jgi:molybdenum cofactor guanylyltransferase
MAAALHPRSIETKVCMGENFTGLVLAGGRSSRFGSDKALAVLGGRSLLERATSALEPWASQIAISAAPGSSAKAEALRLGFPALSDRTGLVLGPLAGILAGLEWSASIDANWMISIPCDVVSLPVDTFSRLLANIDKANGAYAVTADGPQSLCAVWPVDSKQTLETILTDGAHPPVCDLLDLIGAAPVYFEENGSFLNINTIDDLIAAENTLMS